MISVVQTPGEGAGTLPSPKHGNITTRKLIQPRMMRSTAIRTSRRVRCGLWRASSSRLRQDVARPPATNDQNNNSHLALASVVIHRHLRSEKMKRNRPSDVTGRYRLSGAHQGIQGTLLVLTLDLRMHEMDHSVLEAPPLAVSKDEK